MPDTTTASSQPAARAAGAPRTQHVLILGGGIAGLGAALAWAPHAEKVTVVERDEYPQGSGSRAQAPQGEHAHVLLAAGVQSLQRVVPQLSTWLREQGLPAGDLTQHTRVAYDGAWLPRAESGLPLQVATRGHVEACLLRQVRATPNVSVLTGRRVHRLLGDATRVTGVAVFTGTESQALHADVVVDTLGRASPLAGWLRAWGLPVREQVVDAGITYASAWFDPPARPQDDWVILATLPVIPSAPRMAVVARYGPDRLMCSAIAYGRAEVPTTPEALVTFMESVGVPELGALLRASKPASGVSVYGNTANRWRHYGEVSQWPRGLYALGDSACSLNPRYGQGITTSAMGVELLCEHLASAPSADAGRDFQRALDRRLAVPWRMCMLEDKAWTALHEGQRLGLAARFVSWAVQRVLRRAFSDVDTYVRFMRVAQLLDSPTRMLGPGLRALLTPSSGGERAEPPRVAALPG